jgi:hypothetical protein
VTRITDQDLVSLDAGCVSVSYVLPRFKSDRFQRRRIEMFYDESIGCLPAWQVKLRGASDWSFRWHVAHRKTPKNQGKTLPCRTSRCS